MGEGVTYHDYLIQRGRQYKEKHQQQAQEKQGAHKEEEGCTFKPKILTKTFKNKFSAQKDGDELEAMKELQ